MLGLPLGLLYANAGEWLIHRYLLHGLGANKKSVWAFHWYEHHRDSRTHAFRDDHYAGSLLDWGSGAKEAAALSLAALAHAPLFPVAPLFTSTVWFSIANYYRVHRRSHLDPDWAREHLPWHYDHHMGPNQHANWCVTWPWFDWLLGTREPYLGTEREARDAARRKERAARRIAEVLAAREVAHEPSAAAVV